MQQLEFRVKAENGIHSRPAGRLVKTAERFSSDITIETADRGSASAKKLFAIMKLGVKQGDSIRVVFDGPDEASAEAAVSAFLEENF